MIKDWNKYVIKPAAGAMSQGIELANSHKELFDIVKKKTKTLNLYNDLKDLLRKYYFKGYQMESRNREKLIIQQFVPNLKNDWKILVYWDRIYILKRHTRKNDFRASGSGNFVFDKDIPSGILEFSFEIFRELNVTQLSIDVCFDGKDFHVIEFQAIYFGTTTLVKSPFYYKRNNNKFELVEEKSILEEVYAESIIYYIKSKIGNY